MPAACSIRCARASPRRCPAWASRFRPRCSVSPARWCHLLVIDAIHQRDHRHNLDAGFVHIVDGLQFHIEQIADFAVRIGGISNAVKLQVRVTHTCFCRLLSEFKALGKLNSVGRCLHAVESDFARVANCIQKIRRKRRLAARELEPGRSWKRPKLLSRLTKVPAANTRARYRTSNRRSPSTATNRWPSRPMNNTKPCCTRSSSQSRTFAPMKTRSWS